MAAFKACLLLIKLMFLTPHPLCDTFPSPLYPHLNNTLKMFWSIVKMCLRSICIGNLLYPFLKGVIIHLSPSPMLHLITFWSNPLPYKRVKYFLNVNNNVVWLSFIWSTYNNPTYLGIFENGSLGGGSKWPPRLKISNNEVKKLKLVPDLRNHTNFSKVYQKIFCDQNFWWRQHFWAKSGKNAGETFKNFYNFLTKNHIIMSDTF